jgi:DNA-binding SARP family transcriptional activator/tetratricopeptide (TPR) repeat protein
MLRLRLLGALTGEADGRPVAMPAGERARALIGWLAVHPGSHPRAVVADALWPDASAASARANLRTAVWAIRQAWGPAADHLVSSRAAIELAATWVDVADEDGASAPAGSGPPASGGDPELLPGIPDDWAEQAREAHRLRRGETLADRVATARRDGHATEAVRLSRQLCRLDPLDEAAHRNLLECLTEAGDKAGAVLAARDFAALLRAELGVRPAPATRTAHAQLVTATPAAGRPVLFGRASQSRQLAALWRAAADGAGQVVVLTGEAGIGKTSLLAELVHRAGLAGGRTAVGAGGDVVGETPYAVWLELARALVATAARPPEGAGWPVELNRLAPQLGARLGEPGTPPAVTAPELERLRVFEAVLRLVEWSCADRPALIALDDAHRADRASLRLTAHVGRRLGRLPLLLVLIRRDRPGRAELDGVLADLAGRSVPITELTVGPIADAEVAALAASVLATADARTRSTEDARTASAPATTDARTRPTKEAPTASTPATTDARTRPTNEARTASAPATTDARTRRTQEAGTADDALVRQVIAAAEGNPLLAVESARVLAGGGSGPPANLRHAVRATAGLLPPAARTLIHLLAAAGRPLTSDELDRLMVPDAGQAEEAASADGLLVRRAGRLGFRHDLLREAIYADLPNPAPLHDRIANALDAGDRAGIAHHLHLAGRPERAAREWAAAAAYARSVGALTEAAEFLGHAVELCPGDGRLWLDLEDVQAWQGRRAEMEAAWERALELLNGADVVHAWCRRGRQLRTVVCHPEASLRAYRAARAASAQGPDPETLIGLAWGEAVVGDPAVGYALLAEAEALLRTHTDASPAPPPGAGTHNDASPAPPPGAGTHNDASPAPPPGAGTPAAPLPPLRDRTAGTGPPANGAAQTLWSGGSDDAVAYADIAEIRMQALIRQGRFVEAARIAGLAAPGALPDRAYAVWINAACALTCAGDFDGALELADRTIAATEPVPVLLLAALAARAHILARLGRHAEAAETTRRQQACAERLDSPELAAIAAHDAGLVALAAGEHATAAALLGEALDGNAAGGRISRPGAGLSRAEALARLGDATGAAAALRSAMLEPVGRADQPWSLVPRIAWVQGLIAHARGDAGLARRRFAESAAGWRSMLAAATSATAEGYTATLLDLGRPPVVGLVEPERELARIEEELRTCPSSP